MAKNKKVPAYIVRYYDDEYDDDDIFYSKDSLLEAVAEDAYSFANATVYKVGKPVTVKHTITIVETK